MACAVEKTDTGVEIEVHQFDTRESAVLYLNSRRYTYERHETWGMTSGIDFYQGRKAGERASLREKPVSARYELSSPGRMIWSVAFWNNVK